MLSFKKFVTDEVLSEAISHHIEENIPFSECVFRYGSQKYFEFFSELKRLNSLNLLEGLSEDDLELLESDLGEFALYEGQEVPLDFIFEEDTEGKPLNKIHRGGSKKFYVYVRDPSTKNIKKVSFGDTTGLSVKYDNPERKKSFAARHKCSEKTDKTKAGYWACRVNKQLGKSSAARSGYW